MPKNVLECLPPEQSAPSSLFIFCGCARKDSPLFLFLIFPDKASGEINVHPAPGMEAGHPGALEASPQDSWGHGRQAHWTMRGETPSFWQREWLEKRGKQKESER